MLTYNEKLVFDCNRYADVSLILYDIQMIICHAANAMRAIMNREVVFWWFMLSS